MEQAWNFIQTHYGWIIAAVVTIQGFIEKSEKLTKKPLTALLRWVGSFFMAEVIATQTEIKKDLAELRAEVTANEITTWRFQITDFATRCKNGTKDQFEYAFYAINKYYAANPNHNGEVKASEEIIRETYKKLLKEGAL